MSGNLAVEASQKFKTFLHQNPKRKWNESFLSKKKRFSSLEITFRHIEITFYNSTESFLPNCAKICPKTETLCKISLLWKK